MPYNRLVFIILAFCFALAGSAAGETFDQSNVKEQLGRRIPSGLVLRDEKGEKVLLDAIIKIPTVISLVYFSCKNKCPILLGAMAETLTKVPFSPLKDFQVLTVSFDPEDRPERAAAAKQNFAAFTDRSFPDRSWRFLTADGETILKLTEALGFEFRSEPGGFSHPRVLVFVSGDGTVVRYLYGANFNPFDLRMALTESSSGLNSVSAKALLYSYGYDRDENRYLFRLPKVLLTISILSLSSLAVFLLIAKALALERRQWKIH